MVGDRKHDVLGAAAHGIDAAGVLYGYGSREELTAAGAVCLAETPAAGGGIRPWGDRGPENRRKKMSESLIYVAEDDDNIREILRCTLDSYGYATRVFDSAPQAA